MQCKWGNVCEQYERLRKEQVLAQEPSSRQEEEVSMREVGSGQKGQHSLSCHSHPLHCLQESSDCKMY